jgi:hypothetical protein
VDHVLVSSVEPEKLGSKASFQPAGTASPVDVALVVAVEWVGVGVGVGVAVLLTFGVGLGFAAFFVFLGVGDGVALGDAVAAFADTFAFVRPADVVEDDEELLDTANATRPMAHNTATPRAPETIKALRIDWLGPFGRGPPPRWLVGLPG